MWPGMDCSLITLRQMKQIKRSGVTSGVQLAIGNSLTGQYRSKELAMKVKEDNYKAEKQTNKKVSEKWQ